MSNKASDEPQNKQNPEVKQDAGKKPAPENTKEQGQTANIRQNTQSRQQNR